MINTGTFEDACFLTNSIEELELALEEGPEDSELQEWGLSENEWREQVASALNRLRSK